MRLFKEKQNIIDWLETYQVTNYELIPDEKYGYVVDVHDNVRLYNDGGEELDQSSPFLLKVIPVKFNIVEGSFWCYNNKLTSLEFCPIIVQKDFEIQSNDIESLEYCPQRVGRYFNAIGNNKLGSFQNERDFKKVYQEHLRLREIIVGKNRLEEKLENSVIENKIPKKKI